MGKRGRPKGSSQYEDDPILQKMVDAIAARQASNPTQAARLFSEEAEGNSPDSTVKRLIGKYPKFKERAELERVPAALVSRSRRDREPWEGTVGFLGAFTDDETRIRILVAVMKRRELVREVKRRCAEESIYVDESDQRFLESLLALADPL